MVSPYLIALALGWVVSQGSKYVAAAIKNKTFRVFDRLYISGNMPSAHSATVTSVVTVIGLREGFESAIFGLAVAFAMVTMYDALMVRRSVGEQGEALVKLIKNGTPKENMPRLAKGHTPLEVLVGGAIGVCVGIVVFLAT